MVAAVSLVLSAVETSSSVITVDKSIAGTLFDAVPQAADDCFLSAKEVAADPDAARMFQSLATTHGAGVGQVSGIQLLNCRRRLQSKAKTSFCVNNADYQEALAIMKAFLTEHETLEAKITTILDYVGGTTTYTPALKNTMDMAFKQSYVDELLKSDTNNDSVLTYDELVTTTKGKALIEKIQMSIAAQIGVSADMVDVTKIGIPFQGKGKGRRLATDTSATEVHYEVGISRKAPSASH